MHLQLYGSLAEIPLRWLLQSDQGERSTGTLTLRNGNGESTALYFLFGHLFHAEGNGRAGDDAVVSALGWTKGEFEFDAKANPPPAATITPATPAPVPAPQPAPL